MNTILRLTYADASNYKKDLDVVLKGVITQEQISTLESKLEDGSGIIAHQIGLPTPSEQFDEEFDFPTADDHVWTTIEQFEEGNTEVSDFSTEAAPTIDMTVDEFMAKVAEVESWDLMAEIERLDIPDY